MRRQEKHQANQEARKRRLDRVGRKKIARLKTWLSASRMA